MLTEVFSVSERRACKVVNQNRSSQRKILKPRSDEQELVQDVVKLASQYGRYGYRRITALLRSDGWRVNHKRVQRIWRKEGLRVQTERQLQEAGIIYDQLIMGIGGGPRIIINDNKPNGKETAFAINLERNKGINDIIL
jgi:hypothetical protein